MTRDEAVAEIRAIERRCRGPLSADAIKVKNALLAEGRLDEAKHEDEAGRTYCGADFNAIVAAGPLDGAIHTYRCPQCGVTGEYRAPLYALMDGA